MGIKRFRKIILPLLALMFLLSFFQAPTIAATQTRQEEPRSWEFFWEEAKWGSVSALLTMLGFGALMGPACGLACSGVPDPLTREGCLWNCGGTLGKIGFLTFPLGAAVGVVWTAAKYGMHVDLEHLLVAYSASLLAQSSVVFILLHLRYPEFLLGPVGAGLALATVAAADGLGAAYGFNLREQGEGIRSKMALIAPDNS